ncbi:MAG TPA: lytic transglycosylase domain-containing protein [Chitinophagaceae bacterium]|nr:lytic transglycosylase domain-containing protein [Chitinophagaceae bacterium]
MLKRKLVRSGLFGNALLIILAVAHSSGTQITLNSKPVINDTSIHWLRFDPVLLQLSGHSEMDALNAPVITLNKQAVKFVDAYMVKNNRLLSKIKDKHPRYFKIMDEVLTKHKLPVQLKYLAIIESELNINATSHVGAKGPWQLMPGTARVLSLKVTKKYDERTHFYKSTVAASKYLRDLYNLFEDWPLAIAAYNAGPAPVYKAIKKSGSRNFWKLQHFLPEETRGHVKKFIATHYFFEGHGSIVTLTKDERLAHTKAMLAFVENQNKLLEEKRCEEQERKTKDNSSEKEVAIAARVGEVEPNE